MRVRLRPGCGAMVADSYCVATRKLQFSAPAINAMDRADLLMIASLKTCPLAVSRSAPRNRERVGNQCSLRNQLAADLALADDVDRPVAGGH